MDGRKSRTGCWLALVLLCSCSALSFGQSSVEIDPLGIYEISGAQLIELRTERETRETLISEYETRLTKIEMHSEESDRAISDLETLSTTLFGRVQSAEIRAGRYRDLSIVLGATTAGGVLFILFTIFGNPIGG